jgi:hypothetical protein
MHHAAREQEALIVEPIRWLTPCVRTHLAQRLAAFCALLGVPFHLLAFLKGSLTHPTFSSEK